MSHDVLFKLNSLKLFKGSVPDLKNNLFAIFYLNNWSSRNLVPYGQIATQEEHRSFASAVAIKGDQLIAVGSDLLNNFLSSVPEKF